MAYHVCSFPPAPVHAILPQPAQLTPYYFTLPTIAIALRRALGIGIGIALPGLTFAWLDLHHCAHHPYINNHCNRNPSLSLACNRQHHNNIAVVEFNRNGRAHHPCRDPHTNNNPSLRYIVRYRYRTPWHPYNDGSQTQPSATHLLPLPHALAHISRCDPHRTASQTPLPLALAVAPRSCHAPNTTTLHARAFHRHCCSHHII